MKFLVVLLLTMLILLPVQWFLPWWTLGVIALGAGFLANLKAGSSFMLGFLACGLLWWIAATFIHVDTNGILSNKVAAIVKVNSAGLLIFITGLIAALVGGLSALSGRQFRVLFKQ